MSTLLDTDRLRELARDGEERFTALEAELGGRAGITPEMIDRGGLTIHTTYNQEDVEAAIEAVEMIGATPPPMMPASW